MYKVYYMNWRKCWQSVWTEYATKQSQEWESHISIMAFRFGLKTLLSEIFQPNPLLRIFFIPILDYIDSVIANSMYPQILYESDWKFPDTILYTLQQFLCKYVEITYIHVTICIQPLFTSTSLLCSPLDDINHFATTAKISLGKKINTNISTIWLFISLSEDLTTASLPLIHCTE